MSATRLVLLVPLLTGVGCVRGGFELSPHDGSPAGPTDADAATADAATADADTDATADAAGQVPQPLSRWRINEAATGQGPAALVDDTPAPVDLTLTYDGNTPVFAVGSGGGRHLRFDGDSTAGAAADIANTKLDALHGSRAVTLETKFRLDSCTPDTDQQRVFGLGDGDHGDYSSWLTIRVQGAQLGLGLTWSKQAGLVMYYGSPCPAGTLVVMHWVVDTDHPTQAERIRGYVDGVRMPSIDVRRHPGTPGVMPALGDQLSLGAGTRRVYLGRAHSAKRNARSRIFFAAIYDRVLTAQQVAVRASALRTSDD